MSWCARARDAKTARWALQPLITAGPAPGRRRRAPGHGRHDQALRPAPRGRVDDDLKEEETGQDPDADVGRAVGKDREGARSLEHEDGEQCVKHDGNRAADAQPRRQDDVLPAPSEPAERYPGDQQQVEDGQAAKQ